MCDKCFNKEYYKFNSTEEFETFLSEFDTKIAKTLIFVKQEKYKIDNHTVYFCNNCENFWCFSDPDNHWNGYFLKAENAKIFIDKDEQNGKLLKYGCLVILIVTISLTLFKIFI